MQPFDAAAFRKEQEEINDALARTREHGLPVAKALEAALHKANELRDVEKGLDLLRTAWEDAQPALAIVQAAHPGALKYFVDLKNQIKKTIQQGAWKERHTPTPSPEAYPLALA